MLCCPVALRALMAAVLWESNILSIKHTWLFQRLQSTNTNNVLLKALMLKCLLWSERTPSCVTGSRLTLLKFLLLLHWVHTKKELCALRSLKITFEHLSSAIQYFDTVNLSHLPSTEFCFLSNSLAVPYPCNFSLFVLITALHPFLWHLRILLYTLCAPFRVALQEPNELLAQGENTCPNI